MNPTPSTAMVIDPSDVPVVQPAANYSGSPATVDPRPPDTGGNNYEGPIGVTGVIDNITTGCSYSPLSHNALRGPITDIDVPGALGKYGLKMRRYYNSRSSQYWDVAIGLSPGWFHEYSWLMGDDYAHRLISSQGNVSDDYCGDPVGISEWWDSGVRPTNGTGVWRLADGGRVHFLGGFADYIEDPYGVRTTIARDAFNMVLRVTEAGGRYLQFTYGSGPDYTDPAYGTTLLQKVEAWDGQGSLIETVTYTYRDVDSGGRIPPNNQPVIRKMLTGVAYDDTTSASYTYRTDNVPNNPPHTFKFDPLLENCNDKRYAGPMHDIVYDYQHLGPHGAILAEKHGNIAVSSISPGAVFGPPTVDTFTEARGDEPTRRFHYTHLSHCEAQDCGPCDDYDYNVRNGRPPQQMLDWYTDFNNQTTVLGYDHSTWYINLVTDPRGKMTAYARASPPPDGIGQITDITYPENTGTVHYDYQPETGAIPGHYLTSIRDERQNTTTITRDATTHRITQIDYPSDTNTLPSHEEFTYCDQADSQCGDRALGQLKRHRLKNGAYVHYRYNSRGLLVDKWNPSFSASAVETEPKTHYDYYTSGPWTDRVHIITMPANWLGYVATETYEYDRVGNNAVPGRGLVTRITHADSTFQSFSYDQWGNKLTECNELNECTDYEYDDYNRVLSVTRANETTRYTYRPTNGNGNSPYLHTTNNPDTVTLPTGIMTTNVYDRNFRKTSSVVAGRTTWFDYDAVGNQICVTDPRGTGAWTPLFTTKTDYDARNRKWHVWEGWGDGGQNYVTTFTYDNANNLRYIDRPDGTREEKTYDAVNRVLKDIIPFIGGGNPVNLTTRFTYNPSGTIWKVTDPRGSYAGDPAYTTTFDYNASDQRIRMTYPPVNGHSDFQAWDYDDAHNLRSRTTVNGETLLFGYDNRNRKFGESWWQENGEWRFFGLDAASRLRRVTNGIGLWWVNFISDVHRDYDATGRLILDQQALYLRDQTTLTRNVNYEYDPSLHGAEGNPTRMYVSGTDYDYDFRYDDMGRFQKILPHGAANPSFEYSYDNASNETHRLNRVNDVDQSYDPDNLNRIGTVDLRKNGSFAHETYSYYPVRRLESVTREDNRHDQFGYYLDGELYWVMYGVPQSQGVSADTPPAEDPDKEKTVDDFLSLSGWDPNLALTADRTVTYGLDTAGNRDWVDDSVIGFTDYAPNNLNQYTGQVGAGTVVNGSEHELASYKNIQYGYMRDEHLIWVANSSTGDNYQLAYDALGRCVRRTVHIEGDSPRPTPTPHPPPTPPPRPSPPPGDAAKYYFYDGERPILEYDGSGSLVGRNVYGKGIDEILMRYDPTLLQNQTFYYQQDHEGSVTHLTDGNGAVIEKYRYDAFGTPTILDPDGVTVRTASIVSNRFLFTGREYAANFGFYEYRARAYHPLLGRFMSEDPKLFVHRAGFGASPADWTFGAHPDEAEFNLFRYCGNDPIDFTDPSGEFIFPLIDAAFIGYDIYEVSTHPSTENWAALGLDVASAAIPGMTGGGRLFKAERIAQRAVEARRVAEGSKSGKRLLSTPAFKTAKEARSAAQAHGWTKASGMRSKGQDVFTDGKRFFTRDIDGHKGGAWKELDAKGNRIQTLNEKLQRVGP